MDFDSNVNTAGHSDTSGQRGTGLKCKAQFYVYDADKTAGYVVGMKMSDTAVFTVGDDGKRTPVVTEKGDLDEAFSAPFYFHSLPNGQIDYVLIDPDTDTETNTVKKGIVSILQTQLTGNANDVVELEPIGAHTSHYRRLSAENQIVIQKDFSEADFSAFPDPTLNPAAVRLEGRSRVGLTPMGQWQTAWARVSARLVAGSTQEVPSEANFTLTLATDGESSLSNVRPIPPSVARQLFGEPKTANEILKGSDLIKESLLVTVKAPRSAAPLDARFIPGRVLEEPFPHKVDYSWEKMIGSPSCGVKFHGEVFAGTNLDCTHDWFNYKALVDASATVYLFGDSHNLLDANMVYGKQDGRTLADEVKVTLWDDVIYRKKLPALTFCEAHTQNIFNIAKGISVKHTIFISVVPVTFSAGATAELNVDWDWQLCDSKLLADVDIFPSVKVTISGGVEVSIVVAKVGVSLNAFLNQGIRPLAYIHGTKCAIGVQVTREGTPVDVSLEGWFTTRQCHWLRCSWANKKTYPFWHWGLPDQKQVIFEKEWDIRHL